MSKLAHYRYVPSPRVEMTPSDGYYDWTVAQKMQFHEIFVAYKYPEYKDLRAVEVLDTRVGKVWTVYR